MQTVASLSERLDMSPEEAVEKLRYMLFDVDSVESVISDEEIDLLIDVDDDPDVAESIRKTKLKELEKAKKRNERLQKAAKKHREKQAAAKKEAAPRKKAKAKAEPDKAEEAGSEERVQRVIAEILPQSDEGEDAETGAEILADAAQTSGAQILPVEQEEPPKPEYVELPPSADETLNEEAIAAAKAEQRKKEQMSRAKAKAAKAREKDKESTFKIGGALSDAEKVVRVVRADGTQVEAPEIEIDETLTPPAASPEEEEEEQTGVLAEAERQQEEEELRKAREAYRSSVKPDPAVVAEVKKRAAERMRKLSGKPTRKPGTASGKTARKRQKKVERARAEETMRKDAAASVRQIQAAGGLGAGAPKRRKRRRDRDEDTGLETVLETGPSVIEIEESITVEDLAAALDAPINDIILDLMDQNIMATKNQVLGFDVARTLAEKYDVEVHAIIPEEEALLAQTPDNPASLVTRAPVITVMGHVDHGKTTFLDRVRAANVAAGEAGGITQHIAAYDVPIRDGRVVFLDTPGHEAFTQMRARGAQVTDVVVLVVAADDGIMPQTIEAIDHAKAAEVPIVVAVNKIDKPEAQPDRIRQELMRFELVDEKWGGKTVIRDISATRGDGVDELLELLLLEADLLELKVNPDKPARGAIVESEISRGQGPVAWVLVQEGTLRVGDPFLAGESHGRVRAMFNSRGEQVQEAGPSTPVVVTGFNYPPDAGDHFIAVEDERTARAVAEKRASLNRTKRDTGGRAITLEDLQAQLMAGEKSVLNVVVKADVQGSVDVLESSFSKIGNEEAQVKIVHCGVGVINESDVLLAQASEAVIIGFHVTANPRAEKLAEQEGVEIRSYRVIYEAIEDVRKALEGLLTPDTKEVVTGHAEIRKIFRSSAVGQIAGSYVRDGEITRGSLARLLRGGNVIYTGRVDSLRREKDDARTVQTGFECGIKMDGNLELNEGDIVETYRLESVAKTLA